MKTEAYNSILEYFEYFCQISSKSVLTILSTVSKYARFFETQCSTVIAYRLQTVVWNNHGEHAERSYCRRGNFRGGELVVDVWLN